MRKGVDIAYCYVFIECLLRTPSKWDFGAGGSGQKLIANRWQQYHLMRLVGKALAGDPLMSYTSLPKTVKSLWALQLVRRPCLLVWFEF